MWAILTTDGTLHQATEPETPSLSMLQNIVDGYVEVFSLDDGSVMWLNEDGKARGLDRNIAADAVAHAFGSGPMLTGDHIVGNVVFTGGPDDEGETLPLTGEQFYRIRGMVAALGGETKEATV